MSVFVTYPCAGDGMLSPVRSAHIVLRPHAADGNLGSDQGSGATPAGWCQQKQEVATAIGGSRAPSSALAEVTTAAVKMMPAKAGAPSSNLEVKFLNSQAVKPARPARKSGPVGTVRKSGPAGLAGRSAMPGQPGQAAGKKVRRPERNHAWPQRNKYP